MIPHLHTARPSRDLDLAKHFYVTALGFELLGSFNDHAGIDGVMLGAREWPYHLELTRRRDDSILPITTDEDLLVLYLAEPSDWHAAVQRARAAGAPEVAPFNPYWRAIAR